MSAKSTSAANAKGGRFNFIYGHSRTKIAHLHLYIIACTACNLIAIYFDSYSGDIGYWADWVKKLTNGYSEFDGNYPPIYVHWLYVVSHIYNPLDLPVEPNNFLKLLSVLPVIFGHLLLTMTGHWLLQRNSSKPVHYHFAMSLIALNPALLFNGPVWGQVDILPLIPLIASIIASTTRKYLLLTFPLYIIALLTKFQMIAFAPVLGIIFMRNIKTHTLGCLVSLPLVPLAYLPFILADNFTEAFTNAYIKTFSQYGLATMGGANLWILLTGLHTPDSTPLFGIDESSSLANILAVKPIGLALFASCCLLVFAHGINRLLPFRQRKKDISIEDYFFYCMLCTMTFFTFSPAMHSRYLLPAVIISLLYFCTNPKRSLYPILLTLVSTLNLILTLGLHSKNVWEITAWLALAASFTAILDLVLAHKAKRSLRYHSLRLAQSTSVTAFVSLAAIFFTCVNLYIQYKPYHLELKPNEILLTELPLLSQRQGYGRLGINKNVSGKPLNIDGKVYKYGLGTHANSEIKYKLPEEATLFGVSYGIDESQNGASLRFIIKLDEEEVWRSKVLYGFESINHIEIDVTGKSQLSLIVDGMADARHDHANWVNPVIQTSSTK